MDTKNYSKHIYNVSKRFLYIYIYIYIFRKLCVHQRMLTKMKTEAWTNGCLVILKYIKIERLF